MKSREAQGCPICGNELTVSGSRKRGMLEESGEMKPVAKMFKAIHSQESKKAAREKATAVIEELKQMKLKKAADQSGDQTPDQSGRHLSR